MGPDSMADQAVVVGAALPQKKGGVKVKVKRTCIICDRKLKDEGARNCDRPECVAEAALIKLKEWKMSPRVLYQGIDTWVSSVQ